MRVGIVVPGFSAHAEDWCIPALRDLVRELALRHQVHVFALRYPHRLGPYTVDGAAVRPFGGGQAGGVGRIRLLASAISTIAAEHRRTPFDILHAFWSDEPGFVAVAAGRLLGVPAVVSLMGGELARLSDIGYGGRLERVNRLLTRASLAGARRVTVGSAYLGGLCRAGYPSIDPVRLPLGVDRRRFRPDGEPVRLPLGADRRRFDGVGERAPEITGEIALLKVASLVPVKDHDTLLRAFALVHGDAPGARLHLVGDGPLRSPLERLAVELGIAPHVTFHGAVLHDELAGYYRAADLVVQSSRHESQGVAILEALACGTPVVGTAVGILPELRSGAPPVPPRDPAALAAAIHDALEARTGPPALPAELTLEATADRCSAIYETVAGRGHHPPRAPRTDPTGTGASEIA